MKGLTCFAKELKPSSTGDMWVNVELFPGKWEDHFGKSILGYFGR